MTVALKASFKLIIFNTYLVYQPCSHPNGEVPASPIFRASLPVLLDEPYRLRQTTYTWHTFIPHRRMYRRTDRYCLGKTRVSYDEECTKRTETSKRMQHTKFAHQVKQTCQYLVRQHVGISEYLHWQLNAENIKAHLLTSGASFCTSILWWIFSAEWQQIWLHVLPYITNDLYVWQ